MSTGTELVQNALAHLKAHSPVKPANSESLEMGRKKLNGMYARWQDSGIDFGAVPLQALGDEFSEPLGVTNGVEYNLALELRSFLGNGLNPVETQNLARNANITFNEIRRRWKPVTIPQPVVRSTLPMGQGNRYRTFAKPGQTIGSD